MPGVATARRNEPNQISSILCTQPECSGIPRICSIMDLAMQWGFELRLIF